MSYRNKTYVIFDGDNDMWAYAFMKGWKTNDRIDFDFYDAHDIRPLTSKATKRSITNQQSGIWWYMNWEYHGVLQIYLNRTMHKLHKR